MGTIALLVVVGVEHLGVFLGYNDPIIVELLDGLVQFFFSLLLLDLYRLKYRYYLLEVIVYIGLSS